MIYLFVGLLIGSFINVVVYRLPIGKSVVYPGSECLKCNNKLSWQDLIPVISYLILKGKCRFCGVKISVRYPLVELLTGFLFTVVVLCKGEFAVPFLLLTSLLIVITLIDLDTYYIPDVLLVCGVFSWVVMVGVYNFISIQHAFYGALAGFMVMLIIYLLSRGGMGFGDVKFAAMVGLYLGVELTLLALMLAFIMGSVIGGGLLISGLKTRKDALPFGPFIAFGCFVSFLFGSGIVDWYLRISGW